MSGAESGVALSTLAAGFLPPGSTGSTRREMRSAGPGPAGRPVPALSRCASATLLHAPLSGAAEFRLWRAAGRLVARARSDNGEGRGWLGCPRLPQPRVTRRAPNCWRCTPPFVGTGLFGVRMVDGCCSSAASRQALRPWHAFCGQGSSPVLRSVGCPAAVDGQDGAGEIAGLRVGEQEGRAGDLAGRGPPAQGISAVRNRRTCGSSSMPALRGVRNGPGASALTVIPVPASSTARLRVTNVIEQMLIWAEQAEAEIRGWPGTAGLA